MKQVQTSQPLGKNTQSASQPASPPRSTPSRTTASQQQRGSKHGRDQATVKVATVLVGAVAMANTVNQSTGRSHSAPTTPHQFPRPECCTIKKATHGCFLAVFQNKQTLEQVYQPVPRAKECCLLHALLDSEWSGRQRHSNKNNAEDYRSSKTVKILFDTLTNKSFKVHQCSQVKLDVPNKKLFHRGGNNRRKFVLRKI